MFNRKTPIRLMKPNDYERVHAIEHASFPDDPYPEQDIRRWTRSNSSYVVTDDNQNVVGFIVVNVNSDSIHIENIAIAEERRKQGLGSSLLEYVEKKYALKTKSTLCVQKKTFTGNPIEESIVRHLRQFYEKHGYFQTRETNNLIYMEKNIFSLKQKVKKELKAYINRIEGYAGITKPPLENIPFEYGFNRFFFQQSRAANRKANYLLAKELYNDLKQNNPVNFNKENIKTRRNGFFNSQETNRGINSRELNRILNEARKLNFS